MLVPDLLHANIFEVENNYLFLLFKYLLPVAKNNYLVLMFFSKYRANIGKCDLDLKILSIKKIMVQLLTSFFDTCQEN